MKNKEFKKLKSLINIKLKDQWWYQINMIIENLIKNTKDLCCLKCISKKKLL